MSALLTVLAKANLAGAVAVLAVLMLRKPVRRAFGARAAYALWAAVPLAALASLPPRPAAAVLAAPVVLTLQTVREAAIPAPDRATPLLTLIWAAGVLAMLAALIWRQADFLAEVRGGRGGPAVLGFLRPRIVVPADFAERFGAAERELVLSHERAHLARGDAAVNAASAVVTCLCWFNPLAHLAAHLARIDQELACDAVVLERRPELRRLYAETLLKTQLSAQAVPLGCAWPPAGTHPLKERIAMLKSPLPGRRARIAGATVAVGLGAGLAGLAWAAQPGPAPGDIAADTPPTITAPEWMEKPTPADLAKFYPAEAAKNRWEGRVTITCRVDGDGRLANCAVLRSQAIGPGAPDGHDFDFGTATLELAKSFRMAAKDRNQALTKGGVVRIPVLWKLPAS